MRPRDVRFRRLYKQMAEAFYQCILRDELLWGTAFFSFREMESQRDALAQLVRRHREAGGR